jgi:uncharacterized protein (TIGR03437 family)
MLGARPAAAGSVSFSVSMTGEYLAVATADGGATLYMQPFSGTMEPFGQCQAGAPTESNPPTMAFTLANGMTITAAMAFQWGSSPAAPTGVTGTITAGTGIFVGASGTFTGTITANASAGTSTSLPLELTASGTLTAPNAPSGLSVLPSLLTFNIPNGSTAPATANLVVNNEGLEAEPFQVSVTTASGGNWLTASPATGSVTGGATSTIAVTANPAASSSALKAGIYEGLVTVTYGTVPVAVKVRLIVGGLGANLLVSQTGLTFQAGVGGSPSHPETVWVENTGAGSLSQLKATTSVTGGGSNWLNAAITPVAGNPQASQVTITVNPVPPIGGTYYGRVDLTLPGAANSPQSVSVVLQNLTGPLPDISPAGVEFATSWIVGDSGIPVQPQTVKLTNLSTHMVHFTATGGSMGYPKDGASMDWLTFSPASGQMGPGGGIATVTVSVPSACFGKGDPCQLWFHNNGGISFNFVEDNSTAVVNVSLDVDDLMGALGIFGDVARQHPRTATACVPSQVNGVFTTLPTGFQATVGLPVPIEVSLVDSCGKTMDSGAVVAAFSTGDPAVALTSIGAGQWTGTWTPQTAAAAATVTAQAVETAAAAGTVQVSGAIAANTATPIAYAGGIANAASGASVIAPGAFIAIYGADFAAATSVAPAYPFLPLLGNTQVLLGGETLPLYFISTGQIDAIVPYDIEPNSMHQVIVQNGLASSQPQLVAVGTASPGVFTQNQSGSGPGSILGQKVGGNPALNTTANPASAGDYLWIYCTGLGTVSPSIAAGAAATYPPLYNTDNTVTVTVGGFDARVTFAGLAPGYVGLYQVDAIVPTGVATGPSVPVIVTAAGASSAPVTVAIH